jgi:ABC-type phosphate transport system substrate-binding protein
MDKANPFVVPFAFFVHNAGSVSAPDVPVTNLIKAQAQQLYSGQVLNWSKYNAAYDQDVILCIRHAGSGTHATLDWAVMRPAVLVQEAQHPDGPNVQSGLSPIVLTNKGSSDNVECSGDNPGAISYADADKNSGDTAAFTCDTARGDNCRIAYQGNAPTRQNIANCAYDFWAANVIYWQIDEDSQLLQDLIEFAEDPANMAASRALFWAAQGELICDRADCTERPRIKPIQCDDGADNDGDGFTDFPNDPQCTSRLDNDEAN